MYNLGLTQKVALKSLYFTVIASTRRVRGNLVTMDEIASASPRNDNKNRSI